MVGLTLHAADYCTIVFVDDNTWRFHNCISKKILPANITYILILPYFLGVLTAIYTIFKYYTLLN